MDVKVDEMELRKAGYVKAEQFSHVPLSFNMVARILGVSTTTVISYASLGFVPVDDDNKVSLADALILDFKELHGRYIRSRNLVVRSKRRTTGGRIRDEKV